VDQDEGLWKRIFAPFKTSSLRDGGGGGTQKSTLYLEKGPVAVPAHNVEV
jgi:hypothetical protein